MTNKLSENLYGKFTKSIKIGLFIEIRIADSRQFSSVIIEIFILCGQLVPRL